LFTVKILCYNSLNLCQIQMN